MIHLWHLTFPDFQSGRDTDGSFALCNVLAPNQHLYFGVHETVVHIVVDRIGFDRTSTPGFDNILCLIGNSSGIDCLDSGTVDILASNFVLEDIHVN